MTGKSKRQQENLNRTARAALKYLKWREDHYEAQRNKAKKRWQFWR